MLSDTKGLHLALGPFVGFLAFINGGIFNSDQLRAKLWGIGIFTVRTGISANNQQSKTIPASLRGLMSPHLLASATSLEII